MNLMARKVKNKTGIEVQVVERIDKSNELRLGMHYFDKEVLDKDTELKIRKEFQKSINSFKKSYAEALKGKASPYYSLILPSKLNLSEKKDYYCAVAQVHILN